MNNRSQDGYRGRLKKQLEKEDIDLYKRIQIRNRLIDSYMKEDHRTALNLCRELLADIVDVPETTREKIHTYCLLAIALRLNEDYSRALKINLKNLDRLKQTPDDHIQGVTLFEIGTIYYELGEYPDSLDNYLKAFRIFERQKNILMQVQTIISIGNLQGLIGRHEKTIASYKEAINLLSTLDKESHIRPTRLSVMNNLAAEYYDTGQYDECIRLCRSVLKELKYDSDIRIEAAVLSNLARAYLETGRQEEGRQVLETCIRKAEEAGLQGVLIGAYLTLSRFYKDRNQPEKARSIVFKAIELAKNTNSKSRLSNCYEVASGIFESQKDYRNALEYYKKFHKLSREILNEESMNQINALKIIHDVEKTQDKIKLLEKTNARLKSEIEQRLIAEKYLRINEERFKLAKQAGRTGVWDWNLETGQYYLDPEIKAILGYSDEEIANDLDEWMKYVHPDDCEKVVRLAQDHIEGKTDLYELEHRMIHKDGSIKWVYTRGKIIRDKTGKPIRMVGTDTDITDRKKIEIALQESNARLEALFKSARDIIFMKDLSHTYIMINDAMKKLFENKELLALPFKDTDIFDPETSKTHIGSDLRIYEGETIEIESEKKIGGRTLMLHTIKTPIRDKEGKIIGICGIARDITEKKKAEEKIREINERLIRQNYELQKFSSAIHNSANVIIITDKEGIIEYVNPKFSVVTGYSSEEILGKKPSLLKSGYHDDSFYEDLWRTILSGREWHGQFRNKRKDGSLYWEEAHIAPITDVDGKIHHFVAIKENITERINAQKQLQESLAEKELLLKEIHHRVKNNLAIISSLLDLQASSIPEKQIKDRFKECQIRIHTMALIHRNLYETENLGKIDFRRYITDLTNEIGMMFGSRAIFSFDLESIFLDIDTAIPLGLILNELITNAFKHAFPESFMSGQVHISLKQKANTVRLDVRDNGIGLPENLNFETLDSLGIQLILNLTEQIGGTLSWSVENGTIFSLTFPLGH